MSEPKTLLLTETGVEWLPDGRAAVNVGPIVRALKFLTEGRGDDRGTDETGSPLPDLMSLAFDVVESIILGGRKADFFRRVKRELEAQGDGVGRSSLQLATQAKRVQAPAAATALDHAADTLQALLAELATRSLDDAAMQDVKQGLEAFRAFGADRWLSATAQLLIATNALGLAPREKPSRPRAPAKKRRKASSKAPRKASRPAAPAASSTRKKSKKRSSKRR